MDNFKVVKENDNNESGSNDYPYSLFSNTFYIKIESLEKIMNEKCSNMKERIDKLENGEIKRQDRNFNWKVVMTSLFGGSILTLVAQYIINIFNQ